MPTPLLIANWKMNLLPDQAQHLLKSVTAESVDLPVVFASPFPYLPLLSPLIKDKAHIFLGAQDLSAYKVGAYTGEVSGQMLRALGVKFVLVGHSERREYHREQAELLAQKIIRAWENELTPVLCVGENLQIREQGTHLAYIREQIAEVLAFISKLSVEQASQSPLVLAYEPIWAIGTGRTASPEMVQEVHSHIRQALRELWRGSMPSILYGGSVKPENATDLFAMQDVDGALVGGASLQIESMQALIQKFVKAFAKS